MDKDIYRDKYIEKKAERISQAIYLVTNSMNDREPLKWRMREHALSLTEKIGELIQLISLAEFNGLLSVMNAQILSQELLSLKEGIQGQGLYRSASLTHFDFGQKLPIKDNRMSFINNKSPLPSQASPTPVSGIRIQAGNVADFNRALAQRMAPSDGERREKILSIGRSRGEFGIKDVTREVTGVSEKTIQRELISMVKEGLLLKEGERRWSRYSLPR